MARVIESKIKPGMKRKMAHVTRFPMSVPSCSLQHRSSILRKMGKGLEKTVAETVVDDPHVKFKVANQVTCKVTPYF